MKDSYKRSIIKTVSFRLIVLITDSIIIFMVTHDYGKTTVLVIVTTVIRTILYFFHERAWSTVAWGQKRG